jgi:hypothetical protein
VKKKERFSIATGAPLSTYENIAERILNNEINAKQADSAFRYFKLGSDEQAAHRRLLMAAKRDGIDVIDITPKLTAGK